MLYALRKKDLRTKEKKNPINKTDQQTKTKTKDLYMLRMPRGLMHCAKETCKYKSDLYTVTKETYVYKSDLFTCTNETCTHQKKVPSKKNLQNISMYICVKRDIMTLSWMYTYMKRDIPTFLDDQPRGCAWQCIHI